MEKKPFSQRVADKFGFLKPEAEPVKDLAGQALAADEHEKGYRIPEGDNTMSVFDGCPDCEHTGKTEDGEDCPTCEGTGQPPKPESKSNRTHFNADDEDGF